MRKKINTLSLSLFLLLSPATAMASEILVGVGRGEFENETTTRQTYIEVRQDITSPALYLMARYQRDAHPVNYLDGGTAFVGAGMRFTGMFDNIAFEVGGNEKRYLSYLF